MYQFEELRFHYHPTTAVTTTPGVVILAWEPNANRGPPETLPQINAFEHHCEGPSYSPNITLTVPKNRLGGPRYCRAGPTGSDLNFYDTGRLVVAHDKCSTAAGYQTEGYVEVYYKIRYFNYHLEEADPFQSRAAEVRLISATPCTTGVQRSVGFDSIGEDFGGVDSLALNVSGDLLYVPKGMYHITFWATCLDSVSETFIATAEIHKNFLALSPAIYVTNTSAVGGYITVSGSGVITLDNETNTLSTKITLTGAAGTLSVVGARMSLVALS